MYLAVTHRGRLAVKLPSDAPPPTRRAGEGLSSNASKPAAFCEGVGGTLRNSPIS